MSELVGHAPCPHCGQKSEVRKNKRGKLLLDCPADSIFPFQSKKAQEDLQKMTVFLEPVVSENPAPAVAEPPEPKAESKPEPKPEPIQKPVREKPKRWSFFK